jgi:hypothetical protein
MRGGEIRSPALSAVARALRAAIPPHQRALWRTRVVSCRVLSLEGYHIVAGNVALCIAAKCSADRLLRVKSPHYRTATLTAAFPSVSGHVRQAAQHPGAAGSTTRPRLSRRCKCRLRQPNPHRDRCLAAPSSKGFQIGGKIVPNPVLWGHGLLRRTQRDLDLPRLGGGETLHGDLAPDRACGDI